VGVAYAIVFFFSSFAPAKLVQRELTRKKRTALALTTATRWNASASFKASKAVKASR
jgi:hypothetical protein